MQARHILRHARQRQIADRNDMRIGVAGTRMPAAIAEGIKLLDIDDIERRLRRNPFAQTDLEGAMRQRIECAGRQAGRAILPAAFAGDQNLRFFVGDGDDRRGQSDLDGRRPAAIAHSRSSRNGWPS